MFMLGHSTASEYNRYQVPYKQKLRYQVICTSIGRKDIRVVTFINTFATANGMDSYKTLQGI